MKDPVSDGLNILAAGLRTYVGGRVLFVLRDEELSTEVQSWDAQALLIFMWDRWNDLFRNELSFVERSLISELRDFRNRWAHQDSIEENDVYRILDDIERLLKAINSLEVGAVSFLRRESLNRLWMQELGDDERGRRLRVTWPYILCGCSSIAISTAIITFLSAPWSWIMSGLIFLALMRIAWFQSAREARRGPGPHECSHCGRIIYSVECPYCRPIPVERTRDGNDDAESGLRSLAGSWTPFRLTSDSGHLQSGRKSSVPTAPSKPR